VADVAVVQLKERDLELLVKFLGLLGSDQVGERAAAALKVHELAVARGVSWREMLIPDEPDEVPVEVSVGKRTNGRAHFYSPAPPFQQANPFAGQAAQQAAQQAYGHQQNAYHPSHYGGSQAGGLAGGLGGAASGLGGVGGAPGPQPPPPAPWPPGSPAWAPLASEFLQQHAHLTRSPKELQFVLDQVQRARSYAAKTMLSQKQEDWLRDILSRAALTWSTAGLLALLSAARVIWGRLPA